MTRACGPALLLLALVLPACSGAHDDLGDGVMALPDALREVSGIAPAGGSTVACVQDERGALHFVDVATGASRAVPFGPPGDYEGLARVGSEWWVLRSDGWLARVVERGDGLAIASTVALPAGHREWEALCADPERSRLLVVPKRGSPAAGGARRRPLYAIALPAGALEPEPVAALERDDVAARAGQLGLALPTRNARGIERVRLQLACSELLIVPGTGELLLLSAADGLLLRFDGAGRLLAGTRLDRALLPQPEAMAWLPDGRLVLATEGRGGSARLVVVTPP